MPKLNRIQKETTRDVAITFDGEPEPLNLTIVPSRFTVGWQRKAQELGNDIAAIADHFFVVVKDWDLEDEKGVKIPLDQSGTDQLSVETFVAIMTKMTEQLVPNDEATSNS